MKRETAIIVGAGPAGLTAAYELLQRTDITPVIYEMESEVGGICKTIEYKGNRLDIGGHRFFSKSERVLDWWDKILPLQGAPTPETKVAYQGKAKSIPLAPDGPDPECEDRVMLVRKRSSRIYFMDNFFEYPLSLNLRSLMNLGAPYVVKIVLSYIKSRLSPKTGKIPGRFLINRFGKVLYLTFFKSYTEKVWGVSCRDIEPEWGMQRIKGLSLSGAIFNKIKSMYGKNSDLSQRNVETSLIERFMYPKYGPGQMWEEVAKAIVEKGGKICTDHRVTSVKADEHKIKSVTVENLTTGETRQEAADYLFSTMPVKELICRFDGPVPPEVSAVAAGLSYRDFIIVGVLLRKLAIVGSFPPDNWFYIHAPQVKVGRIQLFNNWSPYMVADQDKLWLGMEYFCSEGDELWQKSAEEFTEFATDELVEIGFAEREDILDSTVIKILKTYPAYCDSYREFGRIRAFTDKFPNLFLVGRNGMHRYNNQDHSMMTAMVAVDNIVGGVTDKDNIWSVNLEQEYHEQK